MEPVAKYIGHTVFIAEAIIHFLKYNKFDISNLKCIGCDGCPTNTGKNHGIITIMEETLNRPLQWIVCQLHTNELALCHLIEKLDGKTSGPHVYAGPIGKQLQTCHQLPIIGFESISTSINTIVSNVNKADLSCDQKYLLEICTAISSGECPNDLANKSPGKVLHARWLTTANQILHLYVGTEYPSENLKIITEFIMKVYAPGWFIIKCNPTLKDGSKNLWKIISLSVYLEDTLKTIVHKVIQDNGYFAHPENLLAAMLMDERSYVRQLAVRRILVSRSKNIKGVRKFKIPLINFEARDYIDMIWWQECTVTEPPITTSLSKEDLEDMFLKGTVNTPHFDLLSVPSNTQAMERCIKEVTAAALQVCDAKARDGLVRAKLAD